jgi:small ligand-binding sensory domain FIST
MQWAAALADDAQLDVALERAGDEIWTELDQQNPDLLLAFVSSRYPQPASLLSVWLQQQFSDTLVLGCSAAGILGSGCELEQQPAVVLVAACLPGVNLTPFQLDSADLPDPEASAEAWEQLIGCSTQHQPQFLLLADACSFDPEPLLTGLDLSYPDSKKLGALVGGKSGTLYLNNAIYHSGLIGVALEGNLRLDTVVAQGCRPIGQPLFVTAIDHNRILSLDGQPPPDILRALYQTLPPADQALFRDHLLIGLALNTAMQYRQGDFLVRDLRGIDGDSGALVINALPPRNSVVQFQVRDARAAVEELEQLLAAASADLTPAGALLFSCLGRGQDLYHEPDHDSRVFTRHFGVVPLGGLFAYGEIGPLRGTTFVHSFTSAFGLFRPEK